MNSNIFFTIVILVIIVALILGLIFTIKKEKRNKKKIGWIIFGVLLLIVFCFLLLYIDYAKTFSLKKVNIEELNIIAEKQIETYNLDKINFSASRRYTIYLSVYSDYQLDSQSQKEISDDYKNAFVNTELTELILDKYYDNPERLTINVDIEFYLNKKLYNNYIIN